MLFIKGIFNDAGEINGAVGNKTITIKKAAPGTFFSLFGCIIICYAVFKGVRVVGNAKGKENVAVSSDRASAHRPSHEYEYGIAIDSSGTSTPDTMVAGDSIDFNP